MTSYRYFLEPFKSNVYAWIEIPTIPANNAITITIEKKSGYSPTTDIFLLYDDFDGSSLDTSKWNTNNFTGSYSVSDSNLNIWNNNGGCCSGGCYYHGIGTNDTFDLPARAVVTFAIDGYTTSNGCGKTTATVEYYNNAEVISACDARDQQGINARIGYNAHASNDVPKVPDDENRYIADFLSSGIKVYPSWTSEVIFSDTVPTTTGQGFYLSADTDSSSMICNIRYFFVCNGTTENMPTITIEQIDDNTLKVDIQNNENFDLTNFIIPIEISMLSPAINESLEILNKIYYFLFENPDDDAVYTFDGTNWTQVAANASSLTSSDFVSHGMKSPANITKSDFNNLTTNPGIRVLSYTDNSNVTESRLSKYIVPNDQVVVSDKISLAAYSAIHNINVNHNSKATVYALVSKDGNSWYHYNGSQFVQDVTTSSPTASEITTANWSIDDIANIPSDDWNTFTGLESIYFAFCFTDSQYDQVEKIYSIIFNVDKRGYTTTEQSECEISADNIKVTVPQSGTYEIVVVNNFEIG